jgi:hypothetical protein
MILSNQNILVISNEPWGDVWYSKHNYAYELSKNNKVLFINPPKRWNPLRIFKFKVEENLYNDSLSYISYGNCLPSSIPFLNKLNNYIVSKRLNQWLKKNKNIEDFMVWSFDPMRLYDKKLLDAKFALFHCVDHYNFQFYGEKTICETSDVIFSTSTFFLNDYKQFKTPQFIVPHGISSEEFELDKQVLNITTKELLKNNVSIKDFGLFIGVIDHRIDFELTEQLIQQFPNQQFVFVGPLNLPKDSLHAENIFGKKLYKNVICLGKKPFKTLKYYIHFSKFCFSYMNMKHLGNTVHHHKTLVYLTQGKPVFSSFFTEYETLTDIMYMSNQLKFNKQMLDFFLKNGESSEKATQRINYAKSHTFERILEKASNIISNHLPKP